MLELYHAELSPCAQKVRMVLGEKRLDYQSHIVDILNKDNLKPEYLKLNPNGVVPTLVDDGAPIIESTLINEYLEDTHPQIPLRPSTPRACADMRIWTKLVDEKLHPASGAVTWAITLRRNFLARGMDAAKEAINRVPDIARRNRQLLILEQGFEAAEVKAGIATFVSCFSKMEKALSARDWLLEAGYSLADISMLPYAQGVRQWGLEDVFFGPKTTSWFERIRERPAYQSQIEGYFPELWRKKMLADGAEARGAISDLIASNERAV